MIINDSNFKFIKSSDVKNGDTIIIKDEGVVEENAIYKTKIKNPDGTTSEVPSKQFVFTVDYKGDTRRLSINKMSRANLRQAFGPDTTKWIGKSAMINLAMLATGKNTIILTPILEV